MTASSDYTTTDLHAVIATLRTERDAALAREARRDTDYAERAAYQAATVEVLQAMAASPGDPKPVFELIVRRAHDLCDAYTASLAQVIDGSIVLGAYVVPDEGDAKGHEASFPRPVAADTMFGRAILAREPVQLPDVAADRTYALREGTFRGTVRAQAAVPLMRDGEAIGAINITRRQTGEFSQAQIELLQVFASQAVIAITSAETYRALEQRTAALAQRNSEYGERIEHQSATIDVLKAMSASPGDPQPVFDLIVERARDLCDAYGATVFEFDGTGIHWRAATGVSDDPAVRAAYEAQFPMVPTRGWAFGRAILDRRIIRIDDMEAEPGLDPTLRGITAKSNVTTPIMRGDEVIGAIGMGSREKGGFSDSQVELLKTFAEQAAIAITSAETYRALQARTSDLQETLEYQTATSDVLKGISRSTFDLQPVLDTVVETAAQLCNADQAVIYHREGEAARLAANFGFPPDYETYQKARGAIPIDTPGSAASATVRAFREGRIVHIPDVTAVPGYPDASISLGKQRTSLGVPLLRESEVIGTILLARERVEPFTDRQIELVSTFADQAVIAIENTRLITEQREALEQQTAMGEVLQVINASPGNLKPVFDAVLDKAVRLCEADFGLMLTVDGVTSRIVAERGVPDPLTHFLAQHPPQIGSDTFFGRAVLGRSILHTADMRAEAAYTSGQPLTLTAVDLAGVRALLMAPLRKDDGVSGVFAIFRREARPFTDKQIALLQNFAAQAVIAMENARLLNEQREALEQQTATAEVLQVINASPGDLTPVFEAMLEKAMRLCEAGFGSLYTYDGDRFQSAAQRGVSAAYAAYRERHPPELASGGGLEEAIRSRRAVQVTDMMAERPYLDGNPNMRAMVDLGGVRTGVVVPLCKNETALGVISVFRQEVRPFSEKQIALLENFAAQAVIAMENARLITETREALEQQTATAEVLQLINSSPDDLTPVFDAILEKAHSLCGAPLGSLVLRDGDQLRAVATRGYPEEYEALARQGFPPTPSFKSFLSGEPFVHVLDGSKPPTAFEDHPMRRAAAEISGVRTVLFVPLRKDETVLGYISAQRQEVRPFTDRQIALLGSFAEQAVIAMENARLIAETREALEQQTATAEVLQVINTSPGDLAPVFDAMLEKALRLCEAVFGVLVTYDGERFHATALRGVPPALAEVLQKPFVLPPGSNSARLAAGEAAVQTEDLAAAALYHSGNEVYRAFVELGKARTGLTVALRKDNEFLGALWFYRQHVQPFSDKQIALVQNFAAQAVVAMENARLLDEQREALEQQTAIADVLQVINASRDDFVPVFDKVLEKAVGLCEAAFGSMLLHDGERFNTVSTRNVPAAFADYVKTDRPVHGPGTGPARILAGERVVHVADLAAEEPYKAGDPQRRALVDLGGARSLVCVPLVRDDAVLGLIAVYRPEVRPFSERQIALLQNFAAQAVIAMENARLLDELRQRQEELRITFENMGDGVAMFDGTQHLVAWNGKFQEIFDLPDALLKQHRTYEEHLRFLVERGDFGTGVDRADQIHELVTTTGQPYGYERTRPDGRVIEIRRNPVPDGGFVLIFSDITARKRSEAEIRAARDAAEAAYRDLKTAQASLIQAEKMASLGQLTAGIAHEIKNPLNFVNNFASLSVDLLDELKQTAAPGLAMLDETRRTEVDDLTSTLASNLDKINEHGRRADGIVRSMLEHSRGSSGERRPVDLSAIVDEALNLAYHGARAQDQSFSITLQREFGDRIGPIMLAPQDITRVLLNLFSNGFYAARERQRAEAAGFEPTLKVSTHELSDAVEIRVRDNGIGIPPEIRDRLFQPFFTTKPTGEGTGLGLSMSYDIVTQQHGGSISVDSKVGEYSEFTVRLPRKP